MKPTPQERHLADIWEDIAEAIPGANALIHGDRTISWSKFEQRAAQLAAALEAAGVREGDTVAIDLYNCSEYLETFFAVLKIRAIPANVNYRYVGSELTHVLSSARARALVYHRSLADRILPALGQLSQLDCLVDVDDDHLGDPLPGALHYEDIVSRFPPVRRMYRSCDDRILAFTGGTTGLPKGVLSKVGLVARRSLASRSLLFGQEFDPDADPIFTARRLFDQGDLPVALPASPLMHSTGLTHTSIPALVSGGTVVTLVGRSFDPVELFRSVARTRTTAIAIVGDAFARPMLRTLQAALGGADSFDLSSLRSICSAGVIWSADVKEQLLGFVPWAVLSDSCGSTEGAFYGNRISRAGDSMADTNFVPQPGVRIVDSVRRQLPQGEIGLIAAPTAATGYYNDLEASALRFYEDNGTQYVVPGDYGRIEADDTLTLLGRGSNVINTGGEKVFPEEIEDALRALGGIEDCVVVGLPDERFGEQVCALVQPVVGTVVQVDTLVEQLRQHIAGYKLPRRLAVGVVPRFPNGKVDYPTARQLLSASSA